MLGVTSIDPVRSNLLFERFVSAERREPPDIDVDFEHERREEVIQWVYDSYGRDRAALCATVMRFRARGAVREVGKVMGLSEDVTGSLAGLVWGWSNEGVAESDAAELNLNLDDPRLRMTLALARQLIGFPRHLGQHPGGFVLTRDRLDDLVPIEPAAMADRQVIEWDKDDIDALRFMKVDVLGLGMLGCMRRAFALLEEHRGAAHGPRSHPRRGPGDLRDDPLRRHDWNVPDREPRADVDAAAPEAHDVLRSGDRGRDRPARPDPGRHGASLFAPPREGWSRWSIRRRSWSGCSARRSACRCSRSRR